MFLSWWLLVAQYNFLSQKQTHGNNYTDIQFEGLFPDADQQRQPFDRLRDLHQVSRNNRSQTKGGLFISYKVRTDAVKHNFHSIKRVPLHCLFFDELDPIMNRKIPVFEVTYTRLALDLCSEKTKPVKKYYYSQVPRNTPSILRRENMIAGRQTPRHPFSNITATSSHFVRTASLLISPQFRTTCYSEQTTIPRVPPVCMAPQFYI